MKFSTFGFAVVAVTTFASASLAQTPDPFSPRAGISECIDFTAFPPGSYPSPIVGRTLHGKIRLTYQAPAGGLQVMFTRLADGTRYTGAQPAQGQLSLQYLTRSSSGADVVTAFNKAYIEYDPMLSFGERHADFYNDAGTAVAAIPLWNSPVDTRLNFFFPSVGLSAVPLMRMDIVAQNTTIGLICVAQAEPTVTAPFHGRARKHR